jgi:N-methylhydantoinase A
VPAGTGARPTSTRRIWLEGRPAQAQVYERASLGRGDRVVGPAIVEQPDTTVLVPSGDAATVDRFGNLLVRREA